MATGEKRFFCSCIVETLEVFELRRTFPKNSDREDDRLRLLRPRNLLGGRECGLLEPLMLQNEEPEADNLIESAFIFTLFLSLT